MIVGLTGSMGAGKGEVVKILEPLGFRHITLSQMVRAEARARSIAEEREKLMDVGNDMRKREGAGVLGRRVLAEIEKSGHSNWVVDGIRNPAEIEELRKGNDVHIVGLHARRELLVSRVRARARESDPKTEKEIIARIARELGIKEPPEGQQVGKCMELVDVAIINESTLDELKEKVLTYFYLNSREHGQDALRYSRPSKDAYYLELAKTVCQRGTCTKVEIGAVIIKDDQVIATGYVGAPRGTKSSQEHGFCLRKKLGIPSGQRYEICRSVHAEQNAIINAARAGTSLLGGDIYIFGKTQGSDGARIDAFPCFICKKMIINCGLKRVICSLADGGHKLFFVDEWVKDWQIHDIIDDKFQYGQIPFTQRT